MHRRSPPESALTLEMTLFGEMCTFALEHAEPIAAAADALSVLDVRISLGELAVARSVMHAQRSMISPRFGSPVDAIRWWNWRLLPAMPGPSLPMTATCRPPMVEVDHEDDFGLSPGPIWRANPLSCARTPLLQLLAQMGSFVPAETAHIGVVDRLFSRVGAGDDLAAGRSTFMVEMVETAAILNQATERSLVILDEIGRGTATYDGLAIAWAAAEHLYEANKSRALFATHYHELTALCERLPKAALRHHEGKGMERQHSFPP